MMHRRMIALGAVLVAALGVALFASVTRSQQPEKPPRPPVPPHNVVSDAVAEELAFTRKELWQVRSDLRKLNAELKVFQAKETSPKSEQLGILVNQLMMQDPVVVDLKKRIAETRKELEEFKTKAANPAAEAGYQRSQKLLQDSEKKLSKREEELRPHVLRELQHKSQLEVQAPVEPLKTRIAILREHEKELLANIAQLEGKLNLGDDLSKKVERLESEVRQLRTSIEALKELIKKGQKDK